MFKLLYDLFLLAYDRVKVLFNELKNTVVYLLDIIFCVHHESFAIVMTIKYL